MEAAVKEELAVSSTSQLSAKDIPATKVRVNNGFVGTKLRGACLNADSYISYFFIKCRKER